MTNAIAFLPWAYVDEPLTIGPLRLLPYAPQRLPGDLPKVSQVDLDGVLKAYANRPKLQIKRGAILELGDWYSGMGMTAETLTELYRAKEIVAFAALSKRVLFHGHSHYTNSDAYSLVVQRYVPGDTSTFSFFTRRRDGGTNQVWGSKEYAFHRPDHVKSDVRVDVDENLAAALLGLPREDLGIYEAIVEFNAANSDSSNIPEHVEVVMCKSAFEWLLAIDEKCGSFMKALASVLPREDVKSFSGPLTKKWLERWKTENSRVLMAWARDFCAVRGSAAHGKGKLKTTIWGNAEHLAFVSVLFPLLLKRVLAGNGALKLSEHDSVHIDHVEDYLQHNPFDPVGIDDDHQHPWAKVYSDVRIKQIAKRLYGHGDGG